MSLKNKQINSISMLCTPRNPFFLSLNQLYVIPIALWNRKLYLLSSDGSEFTLLVNVTKTIYQSLHNGFQETNGFKSRIQLSIGVV